MNAILLKKQGFILLFLFVSLLSFGQEQYEVAGIDTLEQWVKKSVQQAAMGQAMTMEIPLVVRSLGWGCECPEHYIGTNPHVQEGPWIVPITPKGFPVADQYGHRLMVQGYFTGIWSVVDLRNEEGEPEEWLYIIPQFYILNWRENN